MEKVVSMIDDHYDPKSIDSKKTIKISCTALNFTVFKSPLKTMVQNDLCSNFIKSIRGMFHKLKHFS